MVHFSTALGLLLTAAATLVSAAPAAAPEPTAAPDLAKRATCTFNNAASASKSKTSCATIVLQNIAVPSGTTLDLTELNSGTQVGLNQKISRIESSGIFYSRKYAANHEVRLYFEGTTTFGYEEWSGPLISVSGSNIQVSGASGHVIDGDGHRWWDGKGGNGGKVKPKFFYAHGVTGSSSISGLYIKNTPVQCFSINGASGLTMSGIAIDNSAGDAGALGHNTDAFDVGSSSNIYISGANVHNQDDCLAINSGTVRPLLLLIRVMSNSSNRASPSQADTALAATACP
jgi:galacturan 1,4-alpha-galacturonidase